MHTTPLLQMGHPHPTPRPLLPPSSRNVTIHLDVGSVIGAARSECTTFFGMPHSRPPVGPLRFRPPQPAEPWTGVLDAREDVAPTCVQQPDGGSFNMPAWVEYAEEYAFGYDNTTMSEDCLKINVQTPSVNGSWPVMLYIHGGSNLIGSGSGYDASALCSEELVFVSFNYRLGVLGTLALPELLDESETTGNYGLQDQRAAMEWVQRHIHKFGGDPARVTISGESAGAMAVGAHLALPRSAELFAQAILMSGNDDSLSLGEAVAAGERLAAWAGCAPPAPLRPRRRLDCLRALDGWALVNLQTAVYNESMRALQAPVADGFEMPLDRRLRDYYAAPPSSPPSPPSPSSSSPSPSSPSSSSPSPSSSSSPSPSPSPSPPPPLRPLLAGSNIDDISIFFGLTLKEILPQLNGEPMVTRADFEASLPRLLPRATAAQRAAVARQYSPTAYQSAQWRRALYDLGTDGYFACPTRRMTRAVAARGGRAFRYVFAPKLADPAALLLPGLSPRLQGLLNRWVGVFHGSNEMLFWNTSAAISPPNQALGARLVRHWASFVRTGAPLAGWPEVGAAAEERYYEFRTGDDADVARRAWHTEQCTVLAPLDFVWNPATLSGVPFVPEAAVA